MILAEWQPTEHRHAGIRVPSQPLTEVSPSATNSGDYAYPDDLRDVDGVLRFVVDGKKCPRNAVLSYERGV
jgi:hypothetical protein